MEITDNIIISEANEFPHSLMQPFYSDFVGIIICQQGMFRFCVDGTSFAASAGETVFLSKGLMFQVLETSQDLQFTLLYYRVEQIRHMLGNTVVAMRLYSTLYPQSCVVMHTEYEEMLNDYIRMLHTLECRRCEILIVVMSKTCFSWLSPTGSAASSLHLSNPLGRRWTAKLKYSKL